MNVDEKKFLAVITGDIIKYSNMSVARRRKLEFFLQECGNKVSEEFPDKLACPITVFRGDSWQLVVNMPVDSLRTALYFRSLLIARRIDTRLAIGIGAVDFLPSGESRAGGGDAFVRSGRRLDLIRSGAGMGFAFPHLKKDDKDDKNAVPELFNGLIDSFDMIFQLMDIMIGRWTRSQALASGWALTGLNQLEIAEKFNPPITQQAVAKHLKAAGWKTVERGMEVFEYNLRRLYLEIQP